MQPPALTHLVIDVAELLHEYGTVDMVTRPQWLMRFFPDATRKSGERNWDRLKARLKVAEVPHVLVCNTCRRVFNPWETERRCVPDAPRGLRSCYQRLLAVRMRPAAWDWLRETDDALEVERVLAARCRAYLQATYGSRGGKRPTQAWLRAELAAGRVLLSDLPVVA